MPVKKTSSEKYQSWYETPRGRWISQAEYRLMTRISRFKAGRSLLDIGCGTGHFSRLFAMDGLSVTGIDTDPDALAFARDKGGGPRYAKADALALPFKDDSFDYCAAVTSLCFIDKPAAALNEMLRVCRRSVTLGLLNRRSLLYLMKREKGGYIGARWDTSADVKTWLGGIGHGIEIKTGSAVLIPTGGSIARAAEMVSGGVPPFGGFLAVSLEIP